MKTKTTLKQTAKILSLIKGKVMLSNQIQNGTRRKVICIEGNIGSGKTTLINRLKNYTSVEALEEPVNKWRTIGDTNLFELMHQDPARWSYTFQNYVLLTMWQNHQKESNKDFLIIERSVYSAIYCFVENLHRDGNFADVEYNVFHEWFEWMTSIVKPRVDLFIYLQTRPEKCMERVQERGRKEDRDLTLDFLRTVHERHEDWLIEEKKYKVPAPVLIVDANQKDFPLDKIKEHLSF